MRKCLTKSKFKLGMECPTKLYYTGKKEYYNRQSDDQFLEALAKGGYQVGELAKQYYPGGIDIEELDKNISLEKTEKFLKEENITLFEAAFKHNHLFIRTDILVKRGNNIELVEVKAKSYGEKDQITNKRNPNIASKWIPYVFDVAFQTYVIQKAYPSFDVHPYLYLVDKTSTCTVEGLNQKFLIKERDGRYQIEVKDEPVNLGDQVLIKVSLKEAVDRILRGESQQIPEESSFERYIESLESAHISDRKKYNGIGSKCANCEFLVDSNKRGDGYKSGFHECWKEQANLSESDLEKPLVFDLWNFRNKDKLLSNQEYFLNDIEDKDLGPANSIERQKIQIQYTSKSDSYIDKAGLRTVFADFSYPLHFIDFETTIVAIPFNNGRRPYEQIAFQFSHHKVEKNGQYAHHTEWINLERGKFPNFDFVRALKKALENDTGSIFRYADHENSILNAIRKQLKDSSEKDKEELINWIETVTHSTKESKEKWKGERDMIDMLAMVKDHFYHPMMKGSNSIKAVLPAILNSSKYLQKKYGSGVYGKSIPSKNFHEQVWITKDNNGVVINPYELLDPIHAGVKEEELDLLLTSIEGKINEGGAAMTAYTKMQFAEMSADEMDRITQSLLRYCELDTLSMVFIYEAWRELISREENA